MRREADIQKNSPLMDFLSAHNCVIYSPLSQNDTSDWINGNEIETYASNSMVWDSANGIWKFQHVSGQPYDNNHYAARWECNFPAQQAVFTGIAEFYAYNVSDTNLCYDFFPTRSGLSLYGTLNALTQSAQVFDRTLQYQYRNGSVVFTYYYPNGVTIPVTTHIRIGVFHNDYQAPAQGPYGLRNFAFFLKALTQQEINEYFNLI